jgi:hypothetical protein
MVFKPVVASVLIAAAGSVAPAGIFTWTAGDGSWDDHANWSGPAGQVPHLTVDSAILGVDSSDVLIESAVALGWMRIHNGASVYTFTGSLFVNGDVIIEDGGSALVVADGPAQRDFDADTVTVRDTFLVLADGTAQFDEALVLDHAALSGAGVVEMNSTTGDFVLGPGSLWAWGSGSNNGRILTVRRTGSSTSVLDWSDPDCSVRAWYDSTLDIQMPVSGVLGGRIHADLSCRIRVADPVIAGPGSRIILSGGASLDDEAVLEAPVVDSYGDLNVSHERGRIKSPLVALRGAGAFGPDSSLLLESTGVVFDSFDAAADGGEGGSIRFGGTQTLTVIGGTTTIATGEGGVFDLDAQGSMTVGIADGSALVLDVERIETFLPDAFDGILNVDGSFHLATYPDADTWRNDGEINLDSGEITGRTLENFGAINGSGSIERLAAEPAGVITADSGTLDIEHLVNGHLSGTVTVQTGDLRVNTTGNYDMVQVRGAMSVGDGQGIPEVVETNNILSVGGEGSSLDVNAGFVRAKNVWIHSELSVQGGSTIRTTGNGIFDHGVFFASQGASTVSGILEIDGGGRAYAGHTFLGEGQIRASKASEDFDFANGADLGDVSFAAAGTVTVNDDNSGVGQASVAGFELEPTAVFRVDVGGPTPGTDHDRISALDAATIAGTLEVGQAMGYVPAMGQTVTILSAPTVSGSFDAVDDSGLNYTRRAEVSVEPDRVDVTFYCSADLNSDGLLDLGDVTRFIQAFTANDMAADLYAPEGILDLADALAFIEMFNTGCS